MSCERHFTTIELAAPLANVGSDFQRCMILWLTMSSALAAQSGPAVEEKPERSDAAAAAGPVAPPATAPDDVEAPADEAPAVERAWYDSVTVTAARTTLDRTDVPANVSVLEDEIRQSAALTIDSVLRQVPGFATLRQQSSVVASVTSQGRSRCAASGGIQREPHARPARRHPDERCLRRLGRVGQGAARDPRPGRGRSRRRSVGVGQSLARRCHQHDDLRAHAAQPLGLGAGRRPSNLRPHPRARRRRRRVERLGVGERVRHRRLLHDPRGSTIGPIDEPTAKESESYLGKASYAPSPGVSLRVSADWWNEDREKGTPLDRGSSEAWAVVGTAGLVSGASTWDFHLFAPPSGLAELLGAGERPTAPARCRRTSIFDQPSDVWGRTPPGRARWRRVIDSSPAPTSSASRSSTIRT